MDVKDLRYFVAVYEARGFSRASRSLGTVQSNVSTRIRSLEDFLGVELFERRYRQIVPTETGEKLYGHAKQVLATLDLTERAVRPQQAPSMPAMRTSFFLMALGRTRGDTEIES